MSPYQDMTMPKTKTNDARHPERLKILFADDEQPLQELMSLELPRLGHQVTVCPDGLTAVAALERNTYDCMIVDLDMPGLGGIEVLERAKSLCPETETVVLTGKSSLETAVSALRHGAFDYLTKPCKLAELQALLAKIATKRELTRKYLALKNNMDRAEGQRTMVGQSHVMARVRRLLEKVAPTPSTVLILGETGTGKELAAQAVHELSSRADQPFVAVNCGALPESLIESELFGHRKGAFTGADENRIGLFEVADGGTLFLDEIGELPKTMQAKLLRVLESGEIRRVGDNEPFKVDVRIVCATHRNLAEMVDEGDFREDLMYRINTFEVYLPPLRERIDDIPDLSNHLFQRFRGPTPQGQTVFSKEALDTLCNHRWPGNIRELANVVEHATILSEQLPITTDDLPRQFGQKPSSRNRLAAGPMSLKELEFQAIAASLERHGGNKAAAAEELGVSLKTLYNKINQSEALNRAA